MAGVSYLHPPPLDEEDAPDGLPHIDSIPCWYQICTPVPDFLPPYDHPSPAAATTNLPSSRPNGSSSSSNSEIAAYESDDLLDRENQVNFVIDLFHQRVEQSHLIETDPFASESFHESNSFGVIENACTVSFVDAFDSELGLGLGINLEEDDVDCGGESLVSDSGDESPLSRRGSLDGDLARETRYLSGLRVVNGVESESESEDSDDVHDLSGIDLRSLDDDYVDENAEEIGLPLYWDSFHLEEEDEGENGFEWEEVDDRIDEREEVLSVIVDSEEEDPLPSLHIYETEEGRRGQRDRISRSVNMEWEVLLGVGHLDRNSEIESDAGTYFGGDGDDYINGAEYEVTFGQLGVGDYGLAVRPPASKSAVENLPSYTMAQEQLLSSNAVCAVCKDEMAVGVVVRQLPCSHEYHGGCILPWLGIRNTCPVCRYELPTDDADYEQRRTQRAARSA